MLSDFSADSVCSIRIFGRQGGNAYRTGTAVDDDDVGGHGRPVSDAAPGGGPAFSADREDGWRHTHLVPYLPGRPYFYHVTL